MNNSAKKEPCLTTEKAGSVEDVEKEEFVQHHGGWEAELELELLVEDRLLGGLPLLRLLRHSRHRHLNGLPLFRSPPETLLTWTVGSMSWPTS